MNLLILGGTQFIGRHLTEAALNAGHNVTLFNRNRRGAGLFSDVETLVGDRQDDVSALAGKTWDAVIDTSAYTPLAAHRRTASERCRALHFRLVRVGLSGFFGGRDRRRRAGRHHHR